MFNLFTDDTIAKKVMEVIKNRIEIAQDRYNRGCTDIDKDADGRIAEIEIKREKQKNVLSEELANNVLGNK